MKHEGIKVILANARWRILSVTEIHEIELAVEMLEALIEELAAERDEARAALQRIARGNYSGASFIANEALCALAALADAKEDRG